MESNPVARLSAAVGTSEPAFRILLSILAGYPLALIYRRFVCGRSALLQHLYFAGTGLALNYFNYGCDIIHSVAALVFTYVTLAALGGTTVAVVVVFLFNMGYLLIGYYVMGTEGYDINWTMPQCVLVLRLIGFAFDIYDGNQAVEKLSSENQKAALTSMPTFLEACGHSFFPSSFLIGPQFPMRRYQDFVAGKYNNGECAPNSVKAAIKQFAIGLAYLALYQLILVRFVNDDYLLSKEFDQSLFVKKCLMLGLWGRYTLYKYISCWLITEGGCILFGITENGVDEKGEKKWDGLANVQIQVLENATGFGHYIQSFNINTNHWLAQYVYKRLKFLGNRLVSQALALLFLAFWHGFHTGYYVSFAFEFVVIYLEKDLKPLLLDNPKIAALLENRFISVIVYIILRIYAFVFMGWCLVPFALLTWERYSRVFISVYGIGFLLFGLYPLIYGPILRRLLKRQRRVHAD